MKHFFIIIYEYDNPKALYKSNRHIFLTFVKPNSVEPYLLITQKFSF